jgi:hypothetical protein
MGRGSTLQCSTPALTFALSGGNAPAGRALQPGQVAGEPASWTRQRGGETKVETFGCHRQPPTYLAQVLSSGFDYPGGFSKVGTRLPQDRWGLKLPRPQLRSSGRA